MCYNILEIENAGMAELADAQDLGDVTSVQDFIASASS